MRLTLTPKSLPPTSSYNVIADWKGSEHPEEVVLVSGHLDSRDLGTGAIDDGAEVAISMQTIHLLQSLNIHPKRTIRSVAWMNEEFGVSGATTYLREHSSELTNHIAALGSDLKPVTKLPRQQLAPRWAHLLVRGVHGRRYACP